MNSFGVYFGDEEWVLKGIGQDLAKALAATGVPSHLIQTTEEVFLQKRLSTDFHIFVQQGQLNRNCEDNPNNVPRNTICLFTHLDLDNFRPLMLKKCKAVIFNSSVQLSQAIANGYSPKNAFLKPHGVNTSNHKIISHENTSMANLLNQIKAQNKIHGLRSSVGFCGRYWSKITYKRRKNYLKIKQIVLKLIELKIPVVILGPGWINLFENEASSPYLMIVDTKYQNYPLFYNLMKVFVSLSVHEGGPLPLLESMACGCYPIVTNTGFSFDVIKNNNSFGEIISPFETNEFILERIVSRLKNNDYDSMQIRNHSKTFSFDNLARVITHISKLP